MDIRFCAKKGSPTSFFRSPYQITFSTALKPPIRVFRNIQKSQSIKSRRGDAKTKMLANGVISQLFKRYVIPMYL